MKIVIGSMNPIKEAAVRQAFGLIFPDVNFLFQGVNAHSNVGDQPLSHGEIYEGALNRVRHSKELNIEGDYYVGLEGGVEEIEGELYNFGWVIIESKEEKRGAGRTVSFVIPNLIRDLMKKEGIELSQAADQIFLKNNTKHGTGTIGPLTKDVLTYTDWYVSAVICALIPFVNKELY